MKNLMLILSIFVLTSSRTAQTSDTKTVTGIVTEASSGSPLAAVNVLIKGNTSGTITDRDGRYSIQARPSDVLVFSFIGYATEEVKVGSKSVIDVKMQFDASELQEIVVTGYSPQLKRDMTGAVAGVHIRGVKKAHKSAAEYSFSHPSPPSFDHNYTPHNTEGYSTIHENEFQEPLDHPFSTFSIDVDVASYANMRRFINNGALPPVDAVRIEEMINYFTYDYPQPKGEDPISLTTEISESPWNPKHRLVHIGLQGKNIPTENLPASNLVFLIDVSGSMRPANRLPLVKTSLRMLVEELRPQDRVAIVVYSGAAGQVLGSTPGNEKEKIMSAIERLEAGGSTAGGAGIKLAYQIAQENFVEEGNNRVIIASDGDFNVGASSNAEMERLIEEKRKSGVFLTVLGYGMGNYKDDKMEILANKGNGNYAYIDNIQEAKKVLVNEFGGTLFTIAKDVKLQIEFNPAKVQAYRLLGYENRLLADEDFHDDTKDAGEMGSGHTVTALYEIIPAGVESDFLRKVDAPKYQKSNTTKVPSGSSQELMTIKFRYKDPDKEVSKLIEKPVIDSHTPLAKTSDNFRFSAAVAGYGLVLRNSKFKQGANADMVVELAEGSTGKDKEGYRAEFIRLVKSSKYLADNR